MQNQTEELWLIDSGRNDQGTGLFLVQTGKAETLGGTYAGNAIPSANQIPLQKVLVENLIYAECVNRAAKASAVAFKWVPNGLAPYTTVLAAARTCVAARCVRRCASYGCLCESGTCK